MRLAQVGPDGMKLDPNFNVDLTKFPTGPRAGTTCCFIDRAEPGAAACRPSGETPPRGHPCLR